MEERDTQRKVHVEAYFVAIKSYANGNQGKIPIGITQQTQSIRKGQADICAELVPKFLPSMPHDPLISAIGVVDNCSSAYDTGYAISKDVSGNITISAPRAEQETIKITKSLKE